MECLGKDSIVLLIPNLLSTDTILSRKIIDYTEAHDVPLIMHTETGDPLLSFTKGPNLCYPGDHTAASVISSNFVLNMLTMTYRNKFID